MTEETLKKVKKIGIPLAIIVILLGMLYSCTAGKYNKFIELREDVDSKWAQVENVYQTRFDLIPNLVETVKGAAGHEENVFTEVAEARSKAGGVIKLSADDLDDPEKLAKFQKAQDSLGGALQRLLSVSENYPSLKTNENFIALQDELASLENKISNERRRYNESAKKYNTAIQMFPGNFVANLSGFRAKSYFSANDEAKSAPKVDFQK